MEHFLQSWGYVAIFAVAFVTTMGVPAGAELAIIYGGVLASGQIRDEPHHLSLVAVVAAAVAGELLGSVAGYAAGRFGGRPLVDRFGKYVLVTHADLDRVEAWFDRHGDRLVLFGRFVPLLRDFVSFAAGLGDMVVGKFLVFTLVGCSIWCTVQASVGYGLGSSYNRAVNAFADARWVLGGVVLVGLAAAVAHRVRAVRRQRAHGREAGEGPTSKA